VETRNIIEPNTNSPTGCRLQGPRHDVALMYRLLRERGFPAEAIKVLADSLEETSLGYDSDLVTRQMLARVAGTPTRKAILDALEQLASQAQKEDFIIIYLSGHGSQQPMGAAGGKGAVEVDGLDDIFLPIDVGRWVDSKHTVENAIVDDELGGFIKRIRDRGAFVWVTVDACHSSNITRAPSDEYVAVRGVDPVDLGVPTSALAAARRPATDGFGIHNDEPEGGGHGGYVGFFAAWKDENAVDAPFPRIPPRLAVHGLLTYAIAQALSRQAMLSYRELAQIVLASYNAYDTNTANGLRAPTPFFEGNLDRIAFAPMLVTRGWVATGVSGRDRELAISGGALSGLANGMEVEIKTPGKLEPVARGRLVNVGIVGSRVALTGPLDARFAAMPLFVEPPLRASRLHFV
jgi:hypothetical protein